MNEDCPHDTSTSDESSEVSQRLSQSDVYHLVTLQAEQTRHWGGAAEQERRDHVHGRVYSQRERRLLCDPMLTNTCFRNLTAGQIDG